MNLDPDACYAAVRSRDPRFDGVFVTAVTSTGIYCRPSCPAMTPRRANVQFHRTAAAAQAAGFRACKRCRPDAVPGSPEWDVRADLVGRAMRLVADGVVDREGVDGLAARLGYSPRQVHRQLLAEVGAGPLALARARRAQTARLLLETTALAVGEVAFAAGFASVRQFNDTIREIFASTPSELRATRRSATEPSPPGTVVVRLPYREPGDVAGSLHFLGVHAVPGVEEYADGLYRRSLALPHGEGVVTLSPGTGAFVRAELALADLRDLSAAVARTRQLLDLDADPAAVAEHLAADPLLAPLVAGRPGRRLAGSVEGGEQALRTVIGQQVSVAGARTVTGRLVARFGKPLTRPVGAVTHLFPAADALAGADPAELPMPRNRGRAIVALAGALATGDLQLDSGVDREAARAGLLALPGIGPWTADIVALRALGDPDSFCPGDLGLHRALAGLGGPATAAGVIEHAERWRPWRGYAVMHLWGTLVDTWRA